MLGDTTRPPPDQLVATIPQGMSVPLADSSMQTTEGLQGTQALLQLMQPTPPLYRIQMPAMLQGFRCYSDAATEPDSGSTHLRPVGLGVSILNTTQKKILQAKVDNISCVLMAEAAALSLAARITSLLQLQGVNFLIDNQLLAGFLNSAVLSTPPDWMIKNTHQFINFSAGSSSKVLR